jgi:hypothetical protein
VSITTPHDPSSIPFSSSDSATVGQLKLDSTSNGLDVTLDFTIPPTSSIINAKGDGNVQTDFGTGQTSITFVLAANRGDTTTFAFTVTVRLRVTA